MPTSHVRRNGSMPDDNQVVTNKMMIAGAGEDDGQQQAVVADRHGCGPHPRNPATR